MKQRGAVSDTKSLAHYLSEEKLSTDAPAQRGYQDHWSVTRMFRNSDPEIVFPTYPDFIYTAAYTGGQLMVCAPEVFTARLKELFENRRYYYNRRGEKVHKDSPCSYDTITVFPPDAMALKAMVSDGHDVLAELLNVAKLALDKWYERTGLHRVGVVVNLNQGIPHIHPFGWSISPEHKLLRSTELAARGNNRLPNLGAGLLAVARQHENKITCDADEYGPIKLIIAKQTRKSVPPLDIDCARVLDSSFKKRFKESPKLMEVSRKAHAEYTAYLDVNPAYISRRLAVLAWRYLREEVEKAIIFLREGTGSSVLLENGLLAKQAELDVKMVRKYIGQDLLTALDGALPKPINLGKLRKDLQRVLADRGAVMEYFIIRNGSCRMTVSTASAIAKWPPEDRDEVIRWMALVDKIRGPVIGARPRDIHL